MKISSVLLGMCLSATLVACDASTSDDAAPDARPRPSASEEGMPAEEGVRAGEGVTGRRAPSVPRRPKVFVGNMDGFRAEVELAIEDLKRIGVWRELTTHLYRIDLTVRAGRSAVKPDRHLADARFWHTEVAHGTYDYPKGRFCWVRFFPAAMADDVARWTTYYEQGLTASPPPSERQFWAAILGHELAHCPKRGAKTTPESVALARETQILEALSSANIE